MKHFIFRLSIALLTLFIGITATSAFVFFTQVPDVEVIGEDEVFCAYQPSNFSEADVEILYNGTLLNRKKNSGIFVVTNKSNQSIYYLAYEKNQHFDNWIKQNGKVKEATDFICHMGMEDQEIKPGESAFFEISVPRNKKPFDVGFEFYIGSEKQVKTFWVNVNERSEHSRILTVSK